MKKLLSLILASLMLSSAVSCGESQPDRISVTASAGAEKYVALFEERVESMPDSLVLAAGEDSASYGVDVTDFVDDEGFFVRASGGDVVILGKTDKGLDRGVRHFTIYGNYDDYTYTYGEGYRVTGLTVMGKPIEGFAVVCPDDADEAMRYAADELVKYLGIATGVTLPVYTAADYTADENAPENSIAFSVDYPALGDEAFTIDVKENGDIDILCGRYRGGLYGAYDLLRDIGWRYIYDGTEYVYESDNLNLTEACDRTRDTAIPNRYTSHYMPDNKFGIYPGGYPSAEVMSKYGLYGIVGKACHGLQSERIDWQGSYEGFNGFNQPCYTDEYVIQAIEDHFRGVIESKIASGQVPGRDFAYIDVAQYDTTPTLFCKCMDCLELMAIEGYNSGAVLRMTNRMADMAAEYSPDICVLMLAYSGTNKPPKVTTPRENVRIAYCFYIGADAGYICSNHNINDPNCKQNREYYEEFEGWKEICGPGILQVWYYSYNCAEIACQVPLFDIGYGDMRYFIDSEIDCIMFCEEYNNDEIILSVRAEMAMNGDITEEEYWDKVAEYFDIYYGSGGKYVLEYIRILLRAGDGIGCWTNWDALLADKLDYSYLAANFEYIMGLFDMALKYAETEEIADRIEMTKARMMYACINATHESSYVNGTADQREIFEERYTEMHRLFKKHALMVYDNYARMYYAPDEIDFAKTPSEYWFTK